MRIIRTVAVLLGYFMVSLFAVAQPVIRIRADAWMPYNGDPKADKPGYVVEIARAVFGAEGIQVDYQTMPWNDALKAARAGEIEAVIGANKTEADGLIAKTSIGAPRMGLFCRKGFQWGYDSISSLRKARLGVIDGYSYWDSLDAYIANPRGGKVTKFSGDAPLADALAKLDGGELDLVAETIPVFVWSVKYGGRKMGDYWLAYTHEAEPIYLAFAKNEQGAKCSAIFDAALKKMRQSGELKRILENYGLTDWLE
jgi:polar amino acid transport system substrate-binding protein